MAKPILAVDVDGVLIDMVVHWLEWCVNVSGRVVALPDIGFQNNLCPVFPEIDALDFWRQNYLYEPLAPYAAAVALLHELSHHFDIGFVTYAKAGHFPSKCRWLKKHFPFYKFINATKEKGYTRCDYAIDDRNNFLNQYPDDVKIIKMITPYAQDEELKRKAFEAEDWGQIYTYLIGELNETV